MFILMYPSICIDLISEEFLNQSYHFSKGLGHGFLYLHIKNIIYDNAFAFDLYKL